MYYRIHLALFFSFPAHLLNNVVIGVKDVAPTTAPNPATSDFKECGRIPGVVGSGETAMVICSPGGVLGQHLVVMIDSSSTGNTLTVCEITAGGGK